jgi:acetylornithine deacetylase/succinyl-diaminopimelate desuccinylase-like protein
MRASIILLVLAAMGTQGTTPTPPERVRQEAREIYARAIAFKSSIGLGQVPSLAAYLADKLRSAGIPDADIHILPLGETASLVARYRGDGTGGRPILFLAHMDVVTANPKEWERDPFTLVEQDGYFFGRGTADVKCGVTVITETFLRLKREGFVPTRDLVIVFTGDEETSQATTRDLVENHRDLVDAELALNADGGGGVLDEGTGKARFYYLQGAEKSYATFELTVHNPGGHSSEPRVENAIYELADALKALQAYRFPVQSNEWTRGSFAASGVATPGALGEAMTRFAANPQDTEASDLLAVEPTYVGRTRTTCVATMLKAGHAENALPQTATATVNCRIFPGTSRADVQAQLQRLAGAKVEITADRGFDSVASPLRDDVRTAVAQAVHASYPGIPIVPDQASYYTDGSILRAAGIPTYGVSGMFLKDSDNFAHGLNERMGVSAFYNGLTHWYVLTKALAGSRR